MKTNRISLHAFNRSGCAATSLLKAAGKCLAVAVIFTAMLEQTQAQTYSLTNVWYVPAAAVSATNIITTGDHNRSLDYDVISNQVFVAARGGGAPAPGIEVLDAATGNYLGLLDKTAVSGGSIAVLNQLGVAQDGAIYAANWTAPNPASLVKLYRWTNWLSPATVAFSGNAVSNNATGFTCGTVRVGDSMAVTGSGTNTQVLIPVGTTSPTATTNMLLFTTADGINFTNHILAITGFSAAGSGILGVSFYTNNTFLVRLSGGSANNVLLIQYPANIASLGVGPIAASQIGSYSLPNVLSTTAFINYEAAGQGGLFAVASPQNSGGASAGGQVALYSDPVLGNPGCSIQLATTNYPHPTTDGNLAGAVALGGAGYAQYIFSLDCNNGVRCTGINTIPAQPPTISSGPLGGTVYPPYTLNVTAAGFCPLIYQWQATNNAGGFTNIPGATSSSYTIAAPSTNYYRLIITNTVNPPATSSVVLVTALQAVTNSAVSSLWRVAAGQSGYSYLSTSDNAERGIAYDTNSQRVVVATTASLYVLNGNNGTNIEQLSQAGVTFGGLLSGCDQVAIADDGAVYAGNVNNSGGNFTLYRWSAPSNSVTATSAFSADPAGGADNGARWGDTMAVRGKGANTQILLGCRAGAGETNIALLTPNDGIGLTYQSQIISVSGVPGGFAGYGISFGAGNTFWAKSSGGDLYEIAFDTNTLTGTVIFNYSQPSQLVSLTGLGVDSVHNIFASVSINDIANDLQLFQLTGTSDAPILFDQAFFASANANGNGNAAITLKYPRAYALDVNNGIVALNYGVPATTAPTINQPPVSTTVYTNIATVTLSVGASGSLPLYYQWRFNSNNISGANSSSYTLTNPPLSAAGYYDVVVHNIAGYVTSTPPALLTLLVPLTSSKVTPLWSIGPGTNSSVNGAFLTTSGYETRGLAYDTNTANLLVADHFNIHEFSYNGQYLSDLTTVGLPSGGVNGWTIDQIGVADDGWLYSANLTLDGTAFSIISYGPSPYNSLNYAYGGATGGSDLNTLDPTPDRWGDTMAIRGFGTSTEILFGSSAGLSVALFTTADGVNFVPQVINITDTNVSAGFAGGGIAFGTNNTFWCKGGHNYYLRQISFNPLAAGTLGVITGAVLQAYAPVVSGGIVPNDLTGIGVDVASNILAGVCYNDAPHDVQLFLLSGNSNPPALFDQDFFPAFNANINENSVVTLKGGVGFALDNNNGVIGFTYGTPNAPGVTLTSIAYAPSSVTITWNNTFAGHSYQVQYKDHLLDANWTSLGSPVPTTGATASYTDTTAAGASRFYRVITQ